MPAKRKIHHLASQAVGEIARATDGAFLVSPHFLDYVLELHELGLAVSGKNEKPRDDLLTNQPLVFGDLVMWPISVGARMWFREYAQPAFPGDVEMQNLCIAYAMTMRGENLCSTLVKRHEIRREVAKWAKSVTVPVDVLNAASLYLMGVRGDDATSNDEGNGQETPDMGSVLSLLVREYGKDFAYWLWEAPEEEVSACLDRYQRQIFADAKAARNMHGGGRHSPVMAPDPNDPGIRAFTRLRHRVKDITAEVKADEIAAAQAEQVQTDG